MSLARPCSWLMLKILKITGSWPSLLVAIGKMQTGAGGGKEVPCATTCLPVSRQGLLPPLISWQMGVTELEGEFRAEEAAAQPHHDKQSKSGLTLGV